MKFCWTISYVSRSRRDISLLLYADMHVNLPIIVFKIEIPAPKAKVACTCKIHNIIVASHVARQAALSLNPEDRLF